MSEHTRSKTAPENPTEKEIEFFYLEDHEGCIFPLMVSPGSVVMCPLCFGRYRVRTSTAGGVTELTMTNLKNVKLNAKVEISQIKALVLTTLLLIANKLGVNFRTPDLDNPDHAH